MMEEWHKEVDRLNGLEEGGIVNSKAGSCSGCRHDSMQHEHVTGCQVENCSCRAWPVTGPYSVFEREKK